MINTPAKPSRIAIHLLMPTISPKIKIDKSVLNIGDAKVKLTVVASGKK